MHRPETEKDRPERPSSDSLMVHLIDEMPLRVVCAVTFVAFFFAWGAVNSLFKLLGRDIESVDAPVGVYAGLIVGTGVALAIRLVKRRGR